MCECRDCNGSRYGQLDRYINLEKVSAEVAIDTLLEELQNKLSDTRGLLLEACFTLSRLKGKAYERNNT